MQSWGIGVLFALAACFCGALGENLIKFSFNEAKKEEREGMEPKPQHFRLSWVVGIVCMTVLNTSLNLASYAFADASLLLPLGGFTICLNLPLSIYMNHEKSSRRSIGFNLVILGGVTVVLLSANHSVQVFTVNELMGNFFRPLFMLCTGVFVAASTYLFFLSKNGKNVLHRKVGMTVFSGMIGSVTQIFAKSMTECLQAGAWGNVFTWMFIILTVVFAVSQVALLNKCLSLYPAYFVVPIVNSTLIVVGSIYAAVFFQEMDRWTMKSAILVPLGISITAIGIAFLSTESEELEEENDEDFAACELQDTTGSSDEYHLINEGQNASNVSTKEAVTVKDSGSLASMLEFV